MTCTNALISVRAHFSRIRPKRFQLAPSSGMLLLLLGLNCHHTTHRLQWSNLRNSAEQRAVFLKWPCQGACSGLPGVQDGCRIRPPWPRCRRRETGWFSCDKELRTLGVRVPDPAPARKHWSAGFTAAASWPSGGPDLGCEYSACFSRACKCSAAFSLSSKDPSSVFITNSQKIF